MNLVRLLPHQASFVQAPYVFTERSYFFLIAGYGSGKTSALVYAILRCVKELLGKKDRENHSPNILVTSKNLTFMKKTLTGVLEQDLRDTNSEYTYDKAHNIITVGNVNILLVPCEDESTIYGFNCCAVFCDELDELPTQNAMAVVKALTERCRQNIPGFRTGFLCFTTTSQGLKGTYQTVMHFKKNSLPYVLIRARTRDNIYLDKTRVENLYKIYNEKERECFLEGQFISVDSGLVFPDYDPSKNKLDVDLFDDIEPEETVYIGQDFNGFGNYAEAFVVRSGAIIMIKEYKLPDMRRAPEVFRYDFPMSRIVWIPDMTYKEHFVEFKKELRTYNIVIAYRSCNPLVADRNFACNKLFYTEHLFLCPICKMADTALMTHQKDPKTGQPKKGAESSPDHLNDCMGYVVHYLLSWCRELKPLYDATLRYMYERRRARGADATELEVGSSLMTADQIKGIPLKKHENA